MDRRIQQLSELQEYTDNIEKEVTSIFQNLQWDKREITEKSVMVVCKHNTNHRIPLKDREMHEAQCYLTELGYHKEDVLLPDPADPSASTLVKFSKQEIVNIIQNAAANVPLFKRASNICRNISQEILLYAGREPLSAARLQHAYSAAERRALHDAVVAAAPCCHDLADLELLSSNDGSKPSQKKSRLEILAELRDMRRRRTKYRVPPKTRNYSHVLRDVIRTQMESYGEARVTINEEREPIADVSRNRSKYDGSDNIPHDVVVKRERLSPEERRCNRHVREYPVERRRDRSLEKRYDDTRSYHRGKKRIDEEKDYYEGRSKHRSRKHGRSHQDDSIDYDLDRRTHSEIRYYSDRKNHSKDKYYSKDKYKSDSGNDRYRNDVIIKQERASSTEYGSEHSSDSEDVPAEKRHRHLEKDRKKHSWGERSGKHYDEQYIPEKLIKQERKSPEKYDSSRKGEGSRKRCRSRSRERRHGDRKTRYRERDSTKKSKYSQE